MRGGGREGKGGIRHWGAVELHGLRSPRTLTGEGVAWHHHLPRPKASCQAASQGVGPSAEQGGASHQHLLQTVCSACAAGRISRSTRGGKGAAFVQRRRIGVLTSRQLMRKTVKIAVRQACTVASSGACSVRAGVPARWSSGQTNGTRAACSARLGDPSASVSPGLQKRPWKHLSFGSAGKIRHFPKVGNRNTEALQAQLPAGACLALPEPEEDFHQFPLA